MLQIYHYDQTTGAFLYQCDADQSPLEENVWLIPAYSTTTPAPETGSNEIALYLDGASLVPSDYTLGDWVIKADWRGVPLWDTTTGHPVSIAAIGQTPSEIGATDEPCPGEEYRWDGTAWTHDDAKASSLAMKDLQGKARALLTASDTTLMRCYEAGIPLPAEWVAYRKALRAIISAKSGDPSQQLPTRPPYPDGP